LRRGSEKGAIAFSSNSILSHYQSTNANDTAPTQVQFLRSD
jgi:hypothetical protein